MKRKEQPGAGAPILVATDGSESAKAGSRVAFELAGSGGNELVFVTVWRAPRADLGIPVPSAIEVAHDWATDTLAGAQKEAEAAGLETTTISRHGVPAEEICAVARERQARMIVLGSHGWGLIEGALFGSVANGVVRHAPCPVLVVPESASARRQVAHAILSTKEE